MNAVFYPAVFHPEETGYSVTVPDIEGCFTQGDTMDEAVRMAQDAIGLMLEECAVCPTPSVPSSLPVEAGDFVVMVPFDMAAYQKQFRPVKKTSGRLEGKAPSCIILDSSAPSGWAFLILFHLGCPGCGSQRLLRCRLHPAGRGPNSSSLFPPLAAVVAVALPGWALYFHSRSGSRLAATLRIVPKMPVLRLFFAWLSLAA